MKKRVAKHWITTDTHFGHEKMPTMCDRPTDFDWKILNGFHIIHEDDVLVHLGDFAFNDHEVWAQRFFERVPCKVWLIKGNHDKRSDFWYLDKGFSVVTRTLTIKRFGKRICFSHKPQENYGQFDVNIFGHFHNNDHRFWETDLLSYITDNHILQAVEWNNYLPVTLESVLDKHFKV